MHKDTAQKEALRLWRALPLQQRLTFRHAIAFAASLAPTLDFDTLGDHDKVVEGWLVRDLLLNEQAVRILDEKTARHARDRTVGAIVEGHPGGK